MQVKTNKLQGLNFVLANGLSPSLSSPPPSKSLSPSLFLLLSRPYFPSLLLLSLSISLTLFLSILLYTHHCLSLSLHPPFLSVFLSLSLSLSFFLFVPLSLPLTLHPTISIPLSILLSIFLSIQSSLPLFFRLSPSLFTPSSAPLPIAHLSISN